MDRMYRLQRYFYDLTRKYYLLGRDQLLKEMNVRPGQHVLEVGCGTARNLIILSRRCRDAHFYGLDASAAMLEIAKRKADASGSKNMVLRPALAGDFGFDKTFSIEDRFDIIFFSYSISMIPPWRESIDNALANLKPGGMLYIVDFFDQKDLPVGFRKILTWWLRKFHVHFWPDLLPYLASLADTGHCTLDVKPLFRGYSFIASLKRC